MRERTRKVKKELERRGLDAFLSTQNIRYLAGTTAGKVVIVPVDGDPVLVCSRLEHGQASEESSIRNIRVLSGWKAPLRQGERVHLIKPWQLIADYLGETGARAVGYDRAGREFIRRLRGAHGASYREMPEFMLELRMVKSKEELTLLWRSAKIAEAGMSCVAESIRVGRTELEIAAEAEYEMRRIGSEGTPYPTIVASGRNSWLPHANVTRKKLRQGELVVVDLGATFEGYASDMTRTFALAPSREQAKLIETVRRAQDAALKKVRGGARARDVDAAARNVIAGAGYAKFFTHGSGHGVGLEIHELPGLSPVSEDVLEKDMVMTVEPGIYLPRVGGARWEDTLAVTSKGYRLLTRQK